MTRALIVDDHPFVRAALRELFAAEQGIDVVGECADGTEVTAAVSNQGADVVLMDLVMPAMSGLDATRTLLEARPSTRVLILTGTYSEASVQEARALGAAGYLLKGDGDALVRAVRAVAARETDWYVEPPGLEAQRH